VEALRATHNRWVKLTRVAIRVFGLTGGIGSGKSTIARRFEQRGVPVVDADLLAREVVARGSEALAEIRMALGPGAIQADGKLDRAWVAARVFEEPELRARLEAITHPRISELAEVRFAVLEALGNPLACYVVPLLYERGLEQRYSPVVVVTSTEAQQLERAAARDGAAEAEIAARVRAQIPLEEKARRADHVIDNSGSLEAALAGADRVLDAICRQIGVDPRRYQVKAG
jgi:dephospho-CoA kinase